jgi:hypothetical protein
MARFQFTEAHFIGFIRYKAGTIVVDTVANKVLGTDIVLPNLSASTLTPHMRPLDSAATGFGPGPAGKWPKQSTKVRPEDELKIPPTPKSYWSK